VTPLRPTGVVLIEGARHEATSLAGFVEKDTLLRVTAADAFKLSVVPDAGKSAGSV
jgi:membrane-bound ClpP family serine protease